MEMLARADVGETARISSFGDLYREGNETFFSKAISRHSEYFSKEETVIIGLLLGRLLRKFAYRTAQKIPFPTAVCVTMRLLYRHSTALYRYVRTRFRYMKGMIFPSGKMIGGRKL
jgi:hypothetical protein